MLAQAAFITPPLPKPFDCFAKKVQFLSYYRMNYPELSPLTLH